jgi:hypothetical protein
MVDAGGLEPLDNSFLPYMKRNPDRHSLDSWAAALNSRKDRESLDNLMARNSLVKEAVAAAGATELDPDVSSSQPREL